MNYCILKIHIMKIYSASTQANVYHIGKYLDLDGNEIKASISTNPTETKPIGIYVDADEKEIQACSLAAQKKHRKIKIGAFTKDDAVLD